MKKSVMISLGAFVIILLAIFSFSNFGSEEGEKVYLGTLDDVTEGEIIDGFAFNEEVYGSAIARYGETYELAAIFDNLPALSEDFFYEGWIVGPSVISTGELKVVGERHVNEFTSQEDLTSHGFYVLTLEPRDGDPSPAAHVSEGRLELVDNAMEVEQVCPEEWYENRMPSINSKSNEREYFIVDGERVELYDLNIVWVIENCNVKKEIVY